MAEEPPPANPKTYVYVEPYHHANTTKHGESNWSWVKLWSRVYRRPVPVCCPCREDGEMPHPISSAVGAHVKLKELDAPDDAPTVPAIIPACSSCNRGGRTFKWNADAILLKGWAGTEPIFFGKLFLHEELPIRGLYWETVHNVKKEEIDGKKYTCVQGETSKKGGKKRVGVPPELRSTTMVSDRRQQSIDYYLDAEEFKKSRCEINKQTGRARTDPKKKNYVSRDDWFKNEWWYYEDDTGFVYDLLRGATVEHPIVSVRNRAKDRITNQLTEFNKKEVIDRVQCVHVEHAEQALPMPTVIEQIVHSMRCLAIEHGQDMHSTVYMDDILKFASLQIEEEKNDSIVQEFVSNGFLYQP